LIQTSNFNSICLISNRKDVVKFCEQAVGSLAKIYTENEFSSSIIRFSNFVLLDSSMVQSEESFLLLKKNKDINKKVILLVPFNNSSKNEFFDFSFIKESITVPSSFSLFRQKIEQLLVEKQLNPKIYFPNENSVLIKSNPEFSGFLGDSKEILKVKNQIINIAKNNQPVLLLGETGTGKTTIAKIIHNLSQRVGNPFVSESIPNLPDQLASSILFGNTEGAYTDAKHRQGLFKAANKGTLFLDEVGFASFSIQGLLLTVIENGIIRTVGKDKEESVDVRLIFATNSDLSSMRKQGLLREDFYQRISAYCITLPALREHILDLPIIVKELLKDLNKEIDEYALEKLMKYTWPGNIRELQNCIKRAATFCKSPLITQEYIVFND